MTTITIDLGELDSKLFVGRINGTLVRDRFGLNAVKSINNLRIKVIIPAYVYNINTSFMLGLLESTFVKFPSSTEFEEAISFDTQGKARAVVTRCLERLIARNVKDA